MTDFFNIGGSSLLLTRLQAALKRTFNVDISIVDLFHQPSPLGIAQKIISHRYSAFAGPRQIDWSMEATLPNETRYYPNLEASSISRSDITHVLLTGVDSSTGLHMLASLLASLLSSSPLRIIHVMGSE